MQKVSEPAKRFGGILIRRERWGLSWRGRAAMVLLTVFICVFLLLNIYPYLATTHRVNSNLLVVEGWVHDYVINAGVTEFKNGRYELVFSTGGPVTGNAGYTSDLDTAASVGASLLRKAGIPAGLVQAVPSHMTGRDRTYSSAIALRDWFQQHNMHVVSINVLTENVHARRTHLLFQEAFGDGVKVGIIAVPNPDYAAGRWWLYSEGVRDVIGEGIAYIYARVFFHPTGPAVG